MMIKYGILILVLVLASCTTTSDQSTTYISKNVEQCKVIKYSCDAGFEPFSDEKGCGCKAEILPKPQAQPGFVSTDPATCAATMFRCDDGLETFFNDSGCGCVVSDKTYCTPGSRNATAIPAIYHPVFGHFNEQIQCITAPCGVNFANEYEACADERIAYWTDGHVGREISYIDPDKICTMEYNPVCLTLEGGFQYIAGNPCVASNIANVISSQPGECNAKKQAIDCPSSFIDMQDSVGACTKEYMPVCGQTQDGGFVQGSNVCQACSTKGVISYFEGMCE